MNSKKLLIVTLATAFSGMTFASEKDYLGKIAINLAGLQKTLAITLQERANAAGAAGYTPEEHEALKTLHKNIKNEIKAVIAGLGNNQTAPSTSQENNQTQTLTTELQKAAK